jgi:hypothetical protein
METETLMCLVCGTENDAGRTHCEACGAELGTATTEPPSTVAMEPEQEPDDPDLAPGTTPDG